MALRATGGHILNGTSYRLSLTSSENIEFTERAPLHKHAIGCQEPKLHGQLWGQFWTFLVDFLIFLAPLRQKCSNSKTTPPN